MTERDAQPLEEVAESILDGRPVDWEAASSRTTGLDRPLLDHLRLIAAVADVHRSAGSPVAREAALLRPATRHETPLSTWGPLDLHEHVGHGSFGDVYRAWDRQLDREVALKLLDETAAREAFSSIVTEGRLLARVRHPNVVTIYGADQIGGRVGLWMEFVRGRTLEQVLRAQGPFSPQEALLVGVDLCRALAAVHHAGVVHRDVKAQNVMREEGGRIVLMDFGTGRGPAGPNDPAEKPTLAGTPLYLAPEQFNGGLATRQSDIYGLGVLLFHLVSRSYPVLGRTVGEIRAAHRGGRRTWLRDVRPDVSDDFVKAIEPALAPDPSARYQSAGEMEQALLEALSGLDARPSRRRTPWRAAIDTLAPSVGTLPAQLIVIVLSAVTVAAVTVAGVSLARSVLQMAQSPASDGLGPAGVVSGSSEMAASRVSLPPTMFVGRPSPDGRFLAYVDVNGDLAVYDLSTGAGRALTTKGQSDEFGESQLAVSPDGTAIAYTWHALDGTNELRIVGADGKWPRVLLRRPDVVFPGPLQWSADGTRILAMLEMRDRTQQLVLIAAATGDTTPVRTFEGGQVHPSLSPDGRFVAYDEAQAENPTARDVVLLDLEANHDTPQPLVQHPANDLFPMWASDGRLLFVSDRTGTLGLWALHVTDGFADGDPELLARDLGRLWMPLGLTADGALYYVLQNGMMDVYQQSIDLFGTTPPGPPTPANPTLIGSNRSPSWSPDGRSLSYVSMRGPVLSDRYANVLVIRDLRTQEQRELRPTLTWFVEPRWSPDGGAILVRGRDLQDREGLFAVDVDNGRTRAALLFPPDVIRSAAFEWSPNGLAIWYDRGDAIVAYDLATGAEEVLIDYAEESIRRLVQQPGFRVSPDGRSLAFTGFFDDGTATGTVVRARVLGGGSIEIARATTPERVDVQDWTPDGSSVLFIRRNSQERRNMLFMARLDGGAPRELGVSMPVMMGLDMHPDGQRVAYTSGSNTTEVWVLKNFLGPSGTPRNGR